MISLGVNRIVIPSSAKAIWCVLITGCCLSPHQLWYVIFRISQYHYSKIQNILNSKLNGPWSLSGSNHSTISGSKDMQNSVCGWSNLHGLRRRIHCFVPGISEESIYFLIKKEFTLITPKEWGRRKCQTNHHRNWLISWASHHVVLPWDDSSPSTSLPCVSQLKSACSGNRSWMTSLGHMPWWGLGRGQVRGSFLWLAVQVVPSRRRQFWGS